jgi:hypothetical protein
MASSRSTNTMAEFLQRMLGDIAEAKTLPDADISFLLDLETTILTKIRGQVDALMGQMEGGGSAGGMPGGASLPQGGMPGAAAMGVGQEPTPPAMAGARVPGTRMEPNMPNIDEMRRMMTQGQ